MSQNTIAEYRNLYTNRHGIQCPLSDAQIRTALANATVSEDAWPLSFSVLTEMETLVTANFPEVDQDQHEHGGNLLAPQDLALDNESSEGFDANFSAATGGNAPYTYQLQIADDDTGAPDATTWADHGASQQDTDEIVVTGLTAETAYWARIKVTDNNGEIDYSNEATDTTGSE